MRFSTSTLGANYHFQPKSVVDPNHLGNVLTVVSDRKIAVASPQDWLDEFTNNDALNQAAAWNTVAAPLNTKSIDTDRIKFTSSNINVGLSKTFATPDATGTNYQISFDLDKGSCTQIKIVVFTAYGQSTPVYSNIVSASGTYVIPFTSQSVIAWIEVKKMADNGVSQSFYLDNIKLNNLSNPSQQVAYFTPDIISATDYGVFGVSLSGRSFNSNSYKYGFGGKEKIDEINGGGNDYDFNNRIYDSRLGRWLSLDPLQDKYPDMSPYSFVSNNPLRFTDPTGAFLLDVHQRITNEAFKAPWKKAFSNDGDRIEFQMGVRGDGSMLLGGGIVFPDLKQQHDKSAHFDQMNFVQIIQNIDRIAQKTNIAIGQHANDKLSNFDLGKEIGKNLHAIQDLYSHSNFVELYAETYKTAFKIGDIPTLEEAFSNEKYSEFAKVLRDKLKTGDYPGDGKGSHHDMNHDQGEGSMFAKHALPSVRKEQKGKKVDWYTKAAEAVAAKASKAYMEKVAKRIERKNK